jgi:hypothetical protein
MADEEDAVATQQLVISDAFPERDAELEAIVQKYNRAKSAAKKAEDAVIARYDALKERMRLLDLDVYHCYDTRHRVEFKNDDPTVKVKPVKEKDPSPYRPSAADAVA